MVEGRVNKYLSEITLLGQPFVKNRRKQTVEKYLKGEGRYGQQLYALRRRRGHREKEG
jgi:translation elongation factor EF-Ts